MALEKLLGIEKQNQAMLKSIQTSVVQLVAAQKKSNSIEQGRIKEEQKAARQAKSDKGNQRAGLMGMLTGGKSASKKEGGGILQNLFGGLKGMVGGVGGALAGAIALPIVLKGAAVLIGGGLILAMKDKGVRDALFSALKWAFDGLVNNAKKLGNHLYHGFFSNFTGGGMSREAKQSRHAKQDSKDKEERKRLTQLIELIDDKEQADRGYFKAASEYEKLKKDNAKAERIEKAKAFMEEQKAKSTAFHDRFGEFDDLIDKHSIDMTTSTRMRTLEEIQFGWFNQGGFDKDLLRETGRYRTGGPVRVPGSGSGDTVPAILPPGSFVMNRNAAGYQTGGVPVMLEPGEDVYGPGQWGPGEMMMNSLMPRFQDGGEVHDYLKKMNDKNISKASAAQGLCVTGSLNTMQQSGVPNPAATGQDEGNNPRGAIVQLVKDFGWASPPGGTNTALNSPYGNVNVNVMSSSQYTDKIKEGGVPSGSLIFQTRHDDWNSTAPRSSGYDFAIAQKNGGALWNGQPHGSLVYGSTKGVIQLTPGGNAIKGLPGQVEGGGKIGPNTPGEDSNAADRREGASPLESFLGNITKGISSALNLPGLGDYMNILGQALGDELGALGNYIFGGGMFDNMMGITPSQAADMASGDGASTTGISVTDPNAKALLAAISKAEGTPSYGTMFGSKVNQELANGQLTVGQAYDVGMRNPGSGATGKYQFMPQTMIDLMNAGVWKRDEKLTPALQDKGAMYLIQNKRGVNLKDGLSQKEVQDLSWEWASIEGNNYTYGGRAQAYVGQSEFMDWYKNAGGTVQGRQAGGVVNMQGASTSNMRRFAQAQQMMDTIKASSSQPIIMNVGSSGGGGGGGGGATIVQSVDGAPPVPNLPDGPNVVALLELQNRLAVGMSI